MVALYKDPQGKNVLKAVKSKSAITQLRPTVATGCNITTVDTDQECDSELATLRERVIQLEARLNKREE